MIRLLCAGDSAALYFVHSFITKARDGAKAKGSNLQGKSDPAGDPPPRPRLSGAYLEKAKRGVVYLAGLFRAGQHTIQIAGVVGVCEHVEVFVIIGALEGGLYGAKRAEILNREAHTVKQGDLAVG